VPDSGQVLHGSQSWRARVPADRFTCAKLGFKADCGDGPIGTAVPARTLSYGFNAIPVVLIDELVQDKMLAMLQVAGLSVVNEEEA